MDIEAIINNVDKIVAEEVEHQDDFQFLSKQHGRVLLAAMTLLWLIQKEETKIFELQSP